MSYNNKKFLDANGVTQIVGLLDDYATNETLSTVVNSVQTALDQKYTKPATGIPASDIADGVIPVADNALSGSSENAIQNKIVKGALDGKAPVIFNSAVGNPAVFSDGANGLPIQSLKIHLLPRQEGTGDPSPENIRSIIPWNGIMVWSSGVNVWDEQWEVGTINTTTGESAQADDRIRAKNYCPCLPNTTYYVVDPTHGKNIRLFYYDQSKSYVGDSAWKDSEVTTPAGAYFFRFIVAASYGTAYNNNISINYPASITAYKPYKPITETDISFPSPVYEGMLDVVSGVLTVTHVLWTNNTADMNNESDYPGWKNAGIRDIVGIGKNELVYTALNIGNTLAVNTNNVNDIVYLPKTSYGMTQDQWQALALDIQIALPLETPQQVQLTPAQLYTLLCNNTILSDANGDIEVVYRADTGLFLKQNTVKDVQVNGSSVLNDGVANIPIANGNTLGVMKVRNTTDGLLIDSNNYLSVCSASDTTVKAGFSNYRVIVPGNQHQSTFYGLAKAAGTDMKDSTNAVGAYTPEAKEAIQKMLGFEDILGNYESSTTASKAYTVGETFIFNGKRYRVTADITQGYVINPGTNCELDPIDGHYVKDTDKATTQKRGLVKIDPNFGIALRDSPYEDVLMINRASDNEIKTSEGYRKPIVPTNQHKAVFYGLAKAAGDTTQSQSDNAVGTYTTEAKTAIRTMIDAIGKTDYATANVPGLVKPGSGIALEASTGKIYMDNASDAQIKGGIATNIAIPPFRQHSAVFYGLTKAAGVDMASSSNAVGTYTEAAKTAIRSMLGIDGSAAILEEVTGTAPTIVGMPNVRYVCGEVSLLTITPPARGSIEVIFTSGSTASTLTVPNTVKWPAWFEAEQLDSNMIYDIIITDAAYGAVMAWAN